MFHIELDIDRRKRGPFEKFYFIREWIIRAWRGYRPYSTVSTSVQFIV